jgi:hypothetical protein
VATRPTTLLPGGRDAIALPHRAPALRARLAARPDALVLALIAAFVLVAIPYLLSLASPLRLEPDSVTYLSRGAGLPLPAHHQSYPPGYPALLSVLDHIGLGTTWGFVGLNLVLLVAGLVAAYVICRRALNLSPLLSALVLLGTLLSRTITLFSSTPVAEVPYFGVALLCLLVLTVADRRRGRGRWRWLALGIALAAAAVSIRVAGLALVAPLLYVAVGGDRLRALVGAIRRGRPWAVAWFVAGAVVLVLAGAVAIRISPYWQHISATWGVHGGFGAFVHNVAIEMRTKVISLGALGSQTNCCVRAPSVLRPAYIVFGLVVGALIVYGWLGRRRFGPVEAFILGTAAVILVYAGGVPRFWIAVIPFLVAYALLGALRLARFRPLRYLVAAGIAGFVIGGGVWLVNSVVLTTAGQSFPRVWSREIDPALQASYRVAWGDPHLLDLVRAEPAAVTLLYRYEPRARRWQW